MVLGILDISWLLFEIFAPFLLKVFLFTYIVGLRGSLLACN